MATASPDRQIRSSQLSSPNLHIRILLASRNAHFLLMDAEYSKYQTTSKYEAHLRMPALSYDGTADFRVRNNEDFEKAYEDPFYLEVVKKDGEHLFD